MTKNEFFSAMRDYNIQPSDFGVFADGKKHPNAVCVVKAADGLWTIFRTDHKSRTVHAETASEETVFSRLFLSLYVRLFENTHAHS